MDDVREMGRLPRISDHVTGFPGHPASGIIHLMRTLRFVLPAVLVLASSCGGGGTEAIGLTVSITPTQLTLTGTRSGTGTSAAVTCSAPISITANDGVGIDFARWVQGNITYTSGSSSNAQVISTSAVGAWFNNTDRVSVGSSVTGAIVLSQPAAFSATVVISYITQTSVGTTPTITVNCQ